MKDSETFEKAAYAFIGNMVMSPMGEMDRPASYNEAWAICFVALPEIHGEPALIDKVKGRPVGKVLALHSKLMNVRPEARSTLIREFGNTVRPAEGDSTWVIA